MSLLERGLSRQECSGDQSGSLVIGSLRRRLYEGSVAHDQHGVDTSHNDKSVREQGASLSSMAVQAALSSEISGDRHQNLELSVDDSFETGDYMDYTDQMAPTAIHPGMNRDLFRSIVGHERRNHRKASVVKIMSYLPAVILGTLLNILDGLSYGMILFPAGLTVFEGLESAGLAMFYMSTIVSQLVFSLGGSKFKACVGSEMIEVVPFFHLMATSIAANLQGEAHAAILATTVAAYIVSAIMTGIVFFLLGFLRLGDLVGFFPRHILVGCIGGVGWFLVVTGIEVSSRLAASFQYNKKTLMFLFQLDTIIKWCSCLVLAIVLLIAERKVTSPLAIPGILIATFFIFHLVVALLPDVSLDDLRTAGFIFEKPPSEEPWYYFYSLLKFNLVSWVEIVKCLPTMLALTFFGLIHVPINIPALAAATKEDDVNVNKELIAHGFSNTISGLLGSIQNYLVYTNSVLFVKAGADSHFAGLLLAAATAAVMFAGPSIIGYIPVIVVASLIFMMGFDLLAEALIDTWNRVDAQEYITIVAIVITAGGYDFVAGIFVGIVLACLFFVITSARRDPISAMFSGKVAHSTVKRHPAIQKFLTQAGDQLYVIKLKGPLFFGTNVRIEKAVKDVVNDMKQPIKFLIIDIAKVVDIDFCSADTFAAIKRLLDRQNIQLILSGVSQNAFKLRGLRAVDIVREAEQSKSNSAKVFGDLATALEYCENMQLRGYYRLRASVASKAQNHLREVPTSMLTAPKMRHVSSSLSASTVPYGVTPRETSLLRAAEFSATEDLQSVYKRHKLEQPLALIMQIMEGISDEPAEFWKYLVPYFQRRHVARGEVLCQTNHSLPGFILVESGILHADNRNGWTETVLAGTTYGELSFFARANCNATLTVESDAVIWILTVDAFAKLMKSPKGEKLTIELLCVAQRLALDRVISIGHYVYMVTA